MPGSPTTLTINKEGDLAAGTVANAVADVTVVVSGVLTDSSQ